MLEGRKRKEDGYTRKSRRFKGREKSPYSNQNQIRGGEVLEVKNRKKTDC